MKSIMMKPHNVFVYYTLIVLENMAFIVYSNFPFYLMFTNQLHTLKCLITIGTFDSSAEYVVTLEYDTNTISVSPRNECIRNTC
jgi:hypothetical protein